MHEEVWINYYGREIAVTKGVADYLEKSREEIRSSNRRYRRWNSPLSQYVNPDRLIAPKLHTGNDPMLSRLIQKERRVKVQEAVSALSADMRRLFYLRYMMEMTQQQIGHLATTRKVTDKKSEGKIFPSDPRIGQISDERFMTLSTGYEDEQRELKARLEELVSVIHAVDDKALNTDRFLRLARKYEDLRELTSTILRELIEKIVVFEREKINGKRGR